MPQTTASLLNTLSEMAHTFFNELAHLPWQNWAWVVALAHTLITLYLLGRILINQRSTGVAVAWLVLLFALPVVGIIAYLLVGEPYLGKRYHARNTMVKIRFSEMAKQADVNFAQVSEALPAKYAGVANIGKSATGFGVYDNHTIELLTTSEAVFNALIADINHAQVSILLEFYIVFPKGRVQEVFLAILAARERGVSCQILADSVGSFSFFTDDWHEKLAEAGVHIYRSLPVGLFKTLFKRTDLRNHRKIVVIDDQIGYTGSFNLVDPKFFKQDKAVGEWVDMLMRIELSDAEKSVVNVVSALTMVCLTDISAESQKNLQDVMGRVDERINEYTRRLYRPEPTINDMNDTPTRVPRLLNTVRYTVHPEAGRIGDGASWQRITSWISSIAQFGGHRGLPAVASPLPPTTEMLSDVTMQLIPSAPQLTDHVIYDTLLTVLHRADKRIQITTPYFVPDEALLSALTTAAKRGVEVVLIVPKKVDSFLVQHASQASYSELLQAGVKIARFTGGLLHTKTVVIDDDYALFGTVNMDLRSFYLNMELSLAIYTPEAVGQIVSCQQAYLEQCEWLAAVDWQQRSQVQRLFDASIRLFSPLL